MRASEAGSAAPTVEIMAQRDHASAISDVLHRALTASGDDQVWLLIDPTVRVLEDDQPLARALVAAGAKPHAVASPHPGVDNSVMPRIAPLNSARASGSATLRLSIEEAIIERQTECLMLGAGRRIGGWLQTSASQAALAEHIARRMVQRRPDGRTSLLRWTDPAVLWVIWSTLDAQQQAALLGPIERYHLLDPAGRLLVLDAPEPASLGQLDGQNFALTDRQWRVLDAVGPLNRALLEFRAARLEAEPLRRARDDGLAALLRARAIGFADARDLAAFALRAMTVHPRFDAHPLLAERFAKRHTNDYFTALVGDIGAEAWSRIARESEVAAPA